MKVYDPKNWYWTIGADRTHVYSSTAGAVIPITDATYLLWSSDGTPATRIDTMDDLIGVLREANVPPYHHVRKSTIISRLTDAQLAQAIGMLSVRQQERWRAPDQPAVNADDPETNAILKAVGADPAEVLAPEQPV